MVLAVASGLGDAPRALAAEGEVLGRRAQARPDRRASDAERLDHMLGDAWSLSPDFKAKYLRGADELELVRSGLDDTMRTAYQSMREVWHGREEVPDLRTAAYLVAIERVAASYTAKGL
jgi:glutamate dehydrogenase (NAD(P)+)